MNAAWQRCLVVPLTGLFLTACGGGQVVDDSCDAEEFREARPNGPVEVTLNDAGRVEVEPDTVRVRRAGVLRFRSTSPFIVFVQRDSSLGLPTDSVLVASRPSASGAGRSDSTVASMDTTAAGVDLTDSARAAGVGPSLAAIPIRAGAACGYYEYDLGVYDGQTGRIVPLDPPVMVLPGG